MPPLTAVERFFERFLERPSARLFRARLQPVQLQRRIERAMESERLTTSDRTLVPNRFVVHLNPDDLAGFGDMTGTLASELADAALSFAKAHRYTVVDRPQVDLLADRAVERTDIRVEARFADAIGGRTGRVVAPGDPEDARLVEATHTRIFHIPKPEAPRASLRITDPDGHTREMPIEPTGLTIGRAADNDLVALDPRVSRHHGRITGRRGTLVYADLGSTNGSRVNGTPVSEVVLGIGDRLEVGDTVLLVEVPRSYD
jgi:hypothetical protein